MLIEVVTVLILIFSQNYFFHVFHYTSTKKPQLQAKNIRVTQILQNFLISANTVKELEGMISEQRQLMEKLTDQCKNLTQKLEDTSHQHK